MFKKRVKPWALTPEEALLTRGHRTEEAVGCHVATVGHLAYKFSLLCGFADP